MRKIFSGILCIAMILSTSIIGFAAEITTSGGKNQTVVSYGMDESFVVVIPADFDLSSNGTTEAEVSASNVMIKDDTELVVFISGDDYVDNWELIDKNESDNRLVYTIGTTEGADDIVNNSEVLVVSAGEAYNNTVVEKMYFNIVDTVSQAGIYTDTLTFTVGFYCRGASGNLYRVNFASSSWEDIILAVENDEVPKHWLIGDTKSMLIGSSSYDVRIIGKHHDIYSDGSGTAPLTLQLVKPYGTYAMNTTQTNRVSWVESQLRTQTMPLLMADMPDFVQDAIKSVDKYTIKGYGRGYPNTTEIETTSDKLFVLSETEFKGTQTYSKVKEGEQYLYYKNTGDYAYGTILWLRTPSTADRFQFVGVDTNGALGLGYSHNKFAVPFAFCF